MDIVNRERIHDSYNGLISIYIEAYSLYSGKKMKNRHLPKKNDWFDMLHILYLQNDHSIKFVSDDTMLKETITSLWPDKHLSAQYILDLYKCETIF